MDVDGFKINPSFDSTSAVLHKGLERKIIAFSTFIEIISADTAN